MPWSKSGWWILIDWRSSRRRRVSRVVLIIRRSRIIVYCYYPQKGLFRPYGLISVDTGQQNDGHGLTGCTGTKLTHGVVWCVANDMAGMCVVCEYPIVLWYRKGV